MGKATKKASGDKAAETKDVVEVKDAETTQGDIATRDGKQVEISNTDADHSFYDPSMPFIQEPKTETQLTDKESRLARQKEGLTLGAKATPSLADEGSEVEDWGAAETLDKAAKMDQVGRQLNADDLNGRLDKNVLADYTIIRVKEEESDDITSVSQTNLPKEAFDDAGSLREGYQIVDAQGQPVNWNSRQRVNWRKDGSGVLYPDNDYGDNVKRTQHD